MTKITLDVKTLEHILHFAEALHLDPTFIWQNTLLLYKVREAVYNKRDEEFNQRQLLDLVLWTYCEKDDFYFKKLKLNLYLHCYILVPVLEHELQTFNLTKQKS